MLNRGSAAEEAMALLEQIGTILSDEPLVRLVYVKALDANGYTERARAALTARITRSHRPASPVRSPITCSRRLA